MQIKNISKNISAKLNDWLNSINDETLKKDVKNNILVSGGSITSMLINDPINDYDIYINNVDVLIRLVEYYTKPFGILIFDGRKKSEYIADLLEDYKWVADTIEEIHSAYKIAVNNLHEDQVKLFVAGGIRVNEDKKESEDPAQKTDKYFPKFFSPNAISLNHDIQIVCRFHGNNEDIHKTFDFIHATNYFTFQEGLVTNKEALESIITKQLKYQGSMYPLTSIIRMKKFIKRGWNINAGEILKIMFQISELDLHNPDVLEEQLIGVDVAYFSTLIKILRGAADKLITSSYLNTLIDRVFNQDEETE